MADLSNFFLEAHLILTISFNTYFFKTCHRVKTVTGLTAIDKASHLFLPSKLDQTIHCLMTQFLFLY